LSLDQNKFYQKASPIFCIAPSNEWRNDPEAIGGIFAEEVKFFQTYRVPADATYSTFPSLTAIRYKELQDKVREMHYRLGILDAIEITPAETPMEDLLR
jgi:hypothetical protein